MQKFNDRFRPLPDCGGPDPRECMLNLFDVAMVFAVALMFAFAMQSHMTEFLTSKDATVIKNAGSPDMEIIVKKDNKVTRYKSEKTTGSGRGKRVGIAYRLESGEVIYVPEENQ